MGAIIKTIGGEDPVASFQTMVSKWFVYDFNSQWLFGQFLCWVGNRVGSNGHPTAHSLAKPLLPLGMTFAAGSMLFVILDEIIPDVSQKGLGQAGTFGVTMGFVAMVMLSLGLG